ncbi:MAG: sodium/solute symporter [Chitinophagaceae bacterium]|nr:sodium/solute symporter [Chitinophagaceae bacterium]
MGQLTRTDLLVFLVYFISVAAYGYWIYKRKKVAQASTKDFFLAEGQLTWWAIGASLIASNISAEQFIGMSGNGFRLGLAIASYEWLAAISLVIVAVFFMPIYLKNRIFTMPQFLKTRYNETVALIMAIFWLFLYVTVNLTSILYLGTIAINNLLGGEYFHAIMIGLALFALIITIGGMKVIGYTDVIQVVVLILGGLVTTYVALTLVSEKFGLGKDVLAGFNKLLEQAPGHFDMIFNKPDANTSQKAVDNYVSLPGLAMLAAGQWIANLNYWGCNQYITQRALGADLPTARTGILFSAFLKLMMPVIVVLPGIAAYVLHSQGELQQQMLTNGEFREDNAYAAILGFLPTGFKGLSMAALTAAIVASLAGKANSISTIFTLDIYKKYFNKEATETKQVWIGRVVIFVAMIFAILINWNDLLGIGGRGGFEFIQKYTGYVSPVIFAVFLLGFFWKRTTARAALVGIVVGTVLAIVFDRVLPLNGQYNTWLYTAYADSKGVYTIPFLVQMGWVFFFTCLVMMIVSLLDKNIASRSHTMQIDKAMFKVEPKNLVLIIILLVLILSIYIKFW